MLNTIDQELGVRPDRDIIARCVLDRVTDEWPRTYPESSLNALAAFDVVEGGIENQDEQVAVDRMARLVLDSIPSCVPSP